MWEKLNLRRVYTKPKGKSPDYTAPVVLRSTACTVEDFVRDPLLLQHHESYENTNKVYDCNSAMPFTRR